MSFSNSSGESAFTQWDSHLENYVVPVEQFKQKTGQQTEMVLNEYIPFVSDYCDCQSQMKLCNNQRYPSSCPNWQA